MIKDRTFERHAGFNPLQLNTGMSIHPRFAPVVPLVLADYMQSRGTLGNYHLLLAHDVLANPKEYRRIYADRGYTILMDNSLVELGYPLPLVEVLEACKIVGAQYAILPDKLNDMQATIDMTKEAIFRWRTIPTEQRGDVGLLPVLQGATHTEHMRMLSGFVMDNDVAGICVPRVIADTIGSRRWIINEAARFYNIHLLGFSENFLDDIACARMPGVVGIDSAVPIRAALRDLIMSLDVPINAGKRECYWDDPFGLPSFLGHPEERVDVICDNVTQVRRWLTR